MSEENFDVVDSYKKIQRYSRLGSDYRREWLKKADQYGLIQKVKHEEIPVMESNRTIKIHEVWNANTEFFIIYSVSLLPSDEEPKDIPYMTFGDIFLHNEENQEARILVDPYETNPNNKMNSTSNTGFVYEERFYRSIWIEGMDSPSFHEEIMEWNLPTVEDGDAVQQRLELVNGVTFTNLQMVDKDWNMTSLNPLTVNMKMTNFTKPLESAQLDGVVQLAPDTTLLFKRYEVSFFEERLYIDIGENKDQLKALTYSLNGHGMQSSIQSDGEGELYIQANEKPMDSGKLSIHFTEASVPSNEEATYQLTGKNMEDFKNDLSQEKPPMLALNETFGKINGDDTFTARSLDYRETPDGNAVSFNVNLKGDNIDYQDYWFRDYAEYLEHKQHDPNEKHLFMDPLVEVTNSNGERLELMEVRSQPSANSININIEIAKDVFIDQNELNFRFFHFSKPYPLEMELIEIPIHTE
ncbi:hypothetical protein ACSVDE_06360 [Pseudalkalibacillus sp. Hm43]|uniref:hypothetical protein n=1 Tax=Pseudalkalibacillus sp. Hm43 TaxID=3450742 RepID=UPI003F41FFF7